MANKGLGVGTEAYQRAMTDLQNTQNNALNQAAYQSVLAGQNAFSNSLNDEIKAANFSNNAQSQFINQLLSALQNSYSGYDVAMDKYNIRSGADRRIEANRQANSAAQAAAGNNFLKSALSAVAMLI